MAEINLLPWREKRREQERKQFIIYLVSGLIIAILSVFFINYYATSLVREQTQMNQRLRDEIVKLDLQIREISQLKKIRQALIARMTIIENLQASRPLTVHLFDEVIKIMPNGAYLTDLERVNDKVTLKGYAESNTNISEIMRNIEASQWMRDPQLTEIKKTSDTKQNVVVNNANDENQFNLSFILKPKRSKELIGGYKFK